MSVLKDIDGDLKTAKEYIESAGRKAKRVKDTDGSDKADKLAERVDELREDFKRKGK